MKIARPLLLAVFVTFFIVPVAIDWGWLDRFYYPGILMLCFGATLLALFFLISEETR